MPVFSLVEPSPDQSIIEMLEDMTERAKRGEITAIAGVTMNPGSEFAEFTSSTADDNRMQFIGFLRVLQMRFERQIPMD